VLHPKKIILSETGLSLLLDIHEEDFVAMFKILLVQYHLCPSSSVILTKKPTHFEVQYATNMEYFYSKIKHMCKISNLFYVGTTLYMFRTVFPSIIRSLRLYIYLMLYVQSYTPDDGRKDRPKHVERCSKIK